MIYDVNTARKFCNGLLIFKTSFCVYKANVLENPNSVEGLLRFAELIRTVRKDGATINTSQSFDSASGRTPLAVLSARDMINVRRRKMLLLVDLQLQNIF